MKLLLDQNLSYRLVAALQSAYPETQHVNALKLGNASDIDIWRYAKRKGYSIVTQDADFHEYSLLYQGPPLIIWLKCGNQPRPVLRDKLLNNQARIEEAAADNETWCIELY